ncbi:MAG: pyridoxamine 5'-phosphate oxidase family protein, partial [Candidatus Rokuibacteriota bacterium]
MNELPIPVRALLERGRFCHVAAVTPDGPHVTPMVFAVAGGRIWVTTSRGSVKARAWRSDPRVAGLVRAGEDCVVFVGTARAHDLLEPSTWPGALAAAPLLAVATTRFTRKNARFFAGYAVDARRVPFAWTPPGRVFVELSIERAALIEGVRRPRTWGEWGDALPTA